MELDPRILEGKKPLDCFDTKIAEQFLGKKGYFSDYLNEYTHICNTEEDVLQSLDEPHDEAYVGTRNKWEFFLPAEWVKPEKKYRPFTCIEFAEKFNLKLNSIITLRSVPANDRPCYNYKVVFTGYRWCDDVFQVFLNGHWLDLPELLELYEYEENGEWHKFGVEE